MYICVSSAYKWYEIPRFFKISARGSVYNENRIGPRTETWGTPTFKARDFDFALFIFTHCCRFSRYDLNQSEAFPFIPTLLSYRFIKIEWHTVSKAADKSRNIVTFPLSIAKSISFWTLIKAVSVLCLLRYADCIGSTILFLSRWSWSWHTIARSISLDMYFKFEIGRKFFSTVVKFFFLINGVMAADLRSSGTKAKYIEELTIRVIVGVNVALHLFKSHVGIGSS